MNNKKYINVSEIDHILLRPDMYIGSIFNQVSEQYIFTDNLIQKKTIEFNYGLYKIFDEIISNSIDEHARNKELTKINITINDNSISVEDNGGITTDFIKEYNCYTPELIFGRLRSGSNFDDTENRKLAGTNGIGAKATNIYSLSFSLETCLNKKLYKQEWTNNMKDKTEPIISKISKVNNYTKITFKPDLNRFRLTEITNDMLLVMKKRCIDLAALNNNIEIVFNNELIKFKSFTEYCKLYDLEDEIFFAEDENWKIGISLSTNGFRQVSFTNNIFNNLGGTHIKYILNQITEYIKPIINKKYKIDVKDFDIRNQLFLFVTAKITNNRFSSQTKELLITDSKNFGSEFEIPKVILNKILKSEIVNQIVDWKRTKLQVDENMEIRKLNKKIEKLKVPNLIDCSSKNRNECVIGIYEGASASSGSMKNRNPKTQASYLLKGKILNTLGLKATKILLNKELAGLISALGLILGNPDITNLRYGKILLITDMDVDGSNICSLLINFLADNWIELFKQNKVFRVLTPLLIIKDGNKQYDIYSDDEYKTFLEKNKGKKLNISFKKGLGALDDSDYKKMLENPKLLSILHDEKYKESLDNWFGKDSNKRKELLLK